MTLSLKFYNLFYNLPLGEYCSAFGTVPVVVVAVLFPLTRSLELLK